MAILTSSFLSSAEIICLEETLCKFIHLLNDSIDTVMLSLVMDHSIFVNELSIGVALFELGGGAISLRVKGISCSRTNCSVSITFICPGI